jgi:hypothetical protein
MDLQKVKEVFAGAGFSPESLVALNGILDAGIARGSFTAEEKERLTGIIDVESELANIELGALEDARFGLESFVNDADATLEAVHADLAAIDASMLSDTHAIADVTEQAASV